MADIYDLAGKRIWVAGHRGLVGSAMVRRLAREECEVLTVGRQQLDLRRQQDTFDWLADTRPDAVVLAAAKVGGIMANDRFPADFLHDNLAIQTNVIEGACRAGVSRLLFLASSAVYPKFAEQPIVEEALLSGPLEPTNQWYAVAKIAGIKLVQAYRRQHGVDWISAMPTNLYGPGDTFDPASGHVLPSLIRRAHEAKLAGARVLSIWGSGTPRREFLHADDCADACVFLMKRYAGDSHVNVGAGKDIAIIDLARLVCEVVGFDGAIATDPSKPDGTPRKLMSAAMLSAMGWTPAIALREGIAATYRSFLANQKD